MLDVEMLRCARKIMQSELYKIDHIMQKEMREDSFDLDYVIRCLQDLINKVVDREGEEE
jgi:hypothetical protein